ncbi:MAG: hypothetical protein EHM93_16725 [Bacteroidales bacterium]|nr:MAG: hypothetical protein EHM93_16725 [Bacteroidales bacterium]
MFLPIKHIKLIIFLLIGFFYHFDVNGQIQVKVSITSGKPVHFSFNTINKYNNGIELIDWTKARLIVDDTRPATITTGWELWAFTSSSDLECSDGSTILISELEIRVKPQVGFTGTPAPGAEVWIPLNNNIAVGRKILEDTDFTSVQWDVDIDFRIGSGGTLINRNWELYYADIIFVLTTVE